MGTDDPMRRLLLVPAAIVQPHLPVLALRHPDGPQVIETSRRNGSAALTASPTSSAGSFTSASLSRPTAPSIAPCSSGVRSRRSIVSPSSSAHSSPRVSRIGRSRWFECTETPSRAM